MTTNFIPSISEEVPWETAHHIRLLYQNLTTLKNGLLAIKPGTTTTNVTEVNTGTGGGGGGGVTMLTGLGGVNDQTGNTTYSTTPSDGGILLVLDDASAVAVSLNAGVATPWMIFATNEGNGLVTFTPTSGLINGGATFTLPKNYLILIVFDGTNWFATPDQFGITDISGLSAALALLAPKASPTFTGTVTQPTPAVLTAPVTATTATAGAATLPTNPLGFYEQTVTISGTPTLVKIPFYSV